MNQTAILTITYEDGTVREITVPDQSILHTAPWVDTMIELFDRGQEEKVSIPS